MQSKIRDVHIESGDLKKYAEQISPDFLTSIRKGFMHTDTETDFGSGDLHCVAFFTRPITSDQLSCYDVVAWRFQAAKPHYLKALARLSVAFRLHTHLFEVIFNQQKVPVNLPVNLLMEINLFYGPRAHLVLSDAIAIVKTYGYRNEYGSVLLLSMLDKGNCLSLTRSANLPKIAELETRFLSSI